VAAAAEAFAEAAAADGIALHPEAFDWYCEQGHVGLERVAQARRDPAIVAPAIAAIEVLAEIHAALRGDASVLGASRENLLLPVALVHAPTRTIVCVDEAAHFTSFRLTALERYRPEQPTGFDRAAYADLCRDQAPHTDRLGGGLPAKGFGFGGQARERAYHDALLDLAAPVMGHPPVVRLAALDGDGAAAYARHCDALRARLRA
jgi:hypothetical protein